VLIKSIRIKGLKSYKDETISDLDKKVNVIVGRNGAGKSNFFFAIKFVLSDMILSEEERRKILHSSAKEQDATAFVEITFDNTSRRFPIEKDEIQLRRIIGIKKDEYFLDSKKVQKTDVRNLLESGGFSSSNPYYIVEQGKVQELADMKANDRLKLLQDVAGATVYDERRDESIKLLKDSERKVSKITEGMKEIDDKLEELNSENTELKEYQKLTKTKRALDHCILEIELAQTRTREKEVILKLQDHTNSSKGKKR